VKREVKEVNPRANWREIAENRIGWREICLRDGLKGRKTPKKINHYLSILIYSYLSLNN